MGFDFGQIGDILSNIMDTDFVDIRRDIDSSLVEVYSNISCHVAYVSIDNPDENTVDIKPIIQGIRIHTPLWVDIRNNDFLIAKKIGSDGSLIATYSGRCGMPVVSQGRKKVFMEMSATEAENPTPIPPTNPIEITISFKSGEEVISSSIVESIEEGESFDYYADFIEGYNPSYYVIDNETRVDSSHIELSNVDKSHDITIYYVVSNTISSFRFLVKGLYTKNDGSLANGWHTYTLVPVNSSQNNSGIYTITCENVEFEHKDNGKILSISPDTLLVLYPNDIFAKIIEISNKENGLITFTCEEFIPSEEQKNYYKTRWYD